MKSGKLLVLTMLVLSSTAALAAPCGGEAGYEYVNYKHRNPTKGGFVSYNAFVDDTDDVYIAPTATVCGSSRINENARVYGTAVIKDSTVSGHAEVFGNARVSGGAEISDNARVSENADISGSVRIYGKAIVAGDARIYNSSQDNLAQVYENARISGSAIVTADASVFGNARVFGNSRLSGDVSVSGNAVINGYTKLSSGSITSGTRNDPDYDGIAKAKKDADIAEANKNAEIQRNKNNQEIYNKKINRYNELVKEVLDYNYLGANSNENKVDLSSLCMIKADYRYKRQLSSMVSAEDFNVRLRINLKEVTSFKPGEHAIGGKKCVKIDINATSAKSEISYVSNIDNKSGDLRGDICFSSWFQSSADTTGVSSVLNEMANICRSL